MATLKIDDITSTSFDARLTGLSTSYGTKYVTWYLDGEPYGYDETVSESDSTSDWITFEGLKPNTGYEVYAMVVYDEAYDEHFYPNEDDYPDGIVITFPDLSNIEIVQRSADDSTTEIAVRAEGLDQDYTGTWVFQWYIYDTDWNEIDTISKSRSGGYANSTTVTFGGLDPGTEYYIDAKVFFDVGVKQYDDWIDNISCTTESSRPYDFSWDVEKVQGEPITITANEWANLQNNINLVRNYKGYSDYNFTSVSVGDNITAEIYNECISAIHTVYPTSLTSYKVIADETIITAEIIDNLRIFINEVE